ncbi:MAG: molybdopterin-dependent oxidoreductase [Myxococcota bacterium]
MTAPRQHFRTCNLCEAMCGLKIEVDGEQILSIRGDDDDPFSRGHICPKAPALAQLQADPDRLRQPMRRTGSGWQPLPWDEALDEAATRLHQLQRAHGRNAIAAYLGNPNVHNLGAMLFGPRLLRQLRTKNLYSATSVDQLPHMLAAHLMFGHQLLLPVPDVDRTSLLIILGANPMVSNGSLMSAPDMANRLRALQERGGRLVVIDPRRSETAARADEHLFIRPGTDALLLLGMLHTIFAENRVRLRELEDIVDGIAHLRSLVRDYTPERVAPLTGIEASRITGLARALADADAGVCYGRIGTSIQPYGALCAWLLYALNIVTGHLDHPGGAMFTTPAVDPIGAPKGMSVSRGGFGRWRSRVRSLPEVGGELPVATLADEILTEGEGQIRGLVTIAGNPVLSTPNGARLERGLAGLETYVAIDFYINESTRHAHLVLPPTSPLERSHYDLIFHTLAIRNGAKLSGPLLDPPPGARHDWQILHELAVRLKQQRGRYPLADRLADAALARLGPEGLVGVGLAMGPYGLRARGRNALSLAALRRAPHGVDLGPLVPCLPERLPKGRIDLVPSPMVADLTRLRADLVEPRIEPTTTSNPDDPAADKPSDTSRGESSLRLIGRRQLRTNNSWMHNMPGLVSGKPRCTLLMHPEDAAARSVEQGDEVCIESRVGRVIAPVAITTDMMPGVVSLPHGFGHGREGIQMKVAQAHAGVSINDLTDESRIDALSGNAALSGVPVTVTAVS